MEGIDESDLSSESEDEIKLPARENIKIPEQFSVDNLLFARLKDPIIPRSYSFQENAAIITENAIIQGGKDSHFIPPAPIEVFINKDGCIFKPFSNQFPFFIFKILEIDENQEEAYFLSYNNTLPQYLIRCIETFPCQVAPSIEIFYSYAHYLVLNNILDSQMNLFKYSQLLSAHTVDYKLWRSFFIYSIKHSLNAIFPLFSVCNFYLFQFMNQEQADNARIEIFLLFFAMICTSEIIEHKLFPNVLHQMRSCLVDVDFDLSQVNYIIKIMTDFFLNVPIEAISSVASFYPMDGIGALLLNGFSIRMILRFFGLSFNNDDHNLNMEIIANELYRIQSLCESDDDENLQKASAVLVLAERALVSAMRITNVPNGVILKMIHSLRFSVKKTDLGLLTRLKEQIHFTRTQFETLSQGGGFNPPQDPNTFF